MGDAYKIDGHKLDYHIDRVFEWKYRGDTTPIYVEISPTSRCNHSCSFCALDYARKGQNIPKQKLLDIGTELARLGVRAVMFGGEGEPTLHPELPYIIRHYSSLGIDCAITTNGTGLGEWFAVEGGEDLKWVKVSMNGGDEETYARVHGTSLLKFEDTWSRITEFRKACKQPPTIGVQAVALDCNLASLPLLCKRAVVEGLDYAVIKPFSDNVYSEACKGVKVPGRVALELMMEECRSIGTDKTPVITRDCAIKSSEEGPCYQKCLAVPYFWFYINSKCEVVACSNHMLDARFILGNLNTRTLRDIWYSHYGMAREELKATMRKFDVSQCRKACRMDRVNEWLWKISNPGKHENFI